MTVLIRVLESRLRGNSPERFGRGERAKAPTYPYKRAIARWYLANRLLNFVYPFVHHRPDFLNRCPK